MTAWKNFLIRAGSAIIALAVIVTLYLTLAVPGLQIAITFAAIVGAWELTKLLFPIEQSLLKKSCFFILSLAIFGASVTSLAAGSLTFAIALTLMIIMVLLNEHKEGHLDQMLATHSKAALGFFYMGLLPSFSYRILEQSEGLAWFAFLLFTVFAGDTLAYIFGVTMGKHKVMPSISPKKTWQGAIGGIIGSVLAALVSWYFLFPAKPFVAVLVLGALSGFFGQFGDFFESLLKRVADVKDSGKVMPGHGGILDRIDGVLFASPVVLAGVLILSHLLS